MKSAAHLAMLLLAAAAAGCDSPGKPLDATMILDVILAIRRDGEDRRVSYATLARIAAVEHVDLGGVADAEQGRLEGDGIVDAQLPDLLFGHRHGELVVGHDQYP